MNFYQEAAQFLEPSKKGSLQNRIFAQSKLLGKTRLRADPKHVFAVVFSALKYRPFLVEIIKAAEIPLSDKPGKTKITLNMAILMAHDLLCSRSKRLTISKGPLKDMFLAHQTRLKSELTRFKMRHKVADLDELVEEDSTPVRWIRINTVLSNVEEFEKTPLIARLKPVDKIVDGTIEPGTIYKDIHVPHLYGIHPREKLANCELYKQGKIIIQDRASCFPATILNPQPGQKLIDCCSAPGNKTTHLASFVGGTPGSIEAFEKDTIRAKLLQKMVKTAGCHNCIRVNVGDFTDTKPEDFPEVEGILVDPSCSGSGIFGRKHEDAAAEETNRDDQKDQFRLHKLSEFQFRIVKHALLFGSAKKVVYSTCSIHNIENEEVVQKLLLDSQVAAEGWQLAPKVRVLPLWERRGDPTGFSDFPENQRAAMAEGVVRALPKVDGGIGFFAACFEKRDMGEVGNRVPKVTEVREDTSSDDKSEEEEEEEWTGFSD
ncbi:25S rRNA (cytosine(2278)-C(5))-methyltransferase [Yarrowia sp. B02]|nr:25S rRNA (cytosine(2278)-C(5))-methyltransferase [Yarrowia sp. B02]